MNYPFTAIVGQQKLKKALMLCAVNPLIGGILIQGDKGTAKSTAVRAVAEIVPPLLKVINCRFNCPEGKPLDICEHCNKSLNFLEEVPIPFINLPLGATEERILGSLDLGAILVEKKKKFQPGLLAAVNQGILYIDEVNLLADHLVDILLDVAALGENIIEREGLSLRHPSRFTLIGTMNPEEGQLRPQLLDRFGIMVHVEAPDSIEERTEVVRRRIAFESDPAVFRKRWVEEQESLLNELKQAKRLLPSVVMSDELLQLISSITTRHQVKSLRADLVIYKTAITLAALHQRTQVNVDDIYEAADFALAHRARNFTPSGRGQSRHESSTKAAVDSASDSSPKPDSDAASGKSTAPGSDAYKAEKNGSGHSETRGESTPYSIGEDGSSRFTDSGAQNNAEDQEEAGNADASAGEPSSSQAGETDASGSAENQDENPEEQVYPAGMGVPVHAATLQAMLATPAVDRQVANNSRPRNRVAGSTPATSQENLALDKTVLQALMRDPEELNIRREDLQQKKRLPKQENLILFVVDASGSMAAGKRMEAVKGTVLSLLAEGLQQRTTIGVIAFRGIEASVLLKPTNSLALARQSMEELPTGGRTPLPHALKEAAFLLKKFGKNQGYTPFLILLTDGKANVGLAGGDPWLQSLDLAAELRELVSRSMLINADAATYAYTGKPEQLATALNAAYITMAEITGELLTPVISKGLGQLNT